MFKFKPSKLTLAMISCGLLTFPGAIYAQEVDEKEVRKRRRANRSY